MAMAHPHRQNDYLDSSSQTSYAPAHAINTEAHHLGKSPQFMHRAGGLIETRNASSKFYTIRLPLFSDLLSRRTVFGSEISVHHKLQHTIAFPMGTTTYFLGIDRLAARCTHVQR